MFAPLGIKDAAFQRARLGLSEEEMRERWAWVTHRAQDGERSIVAAEAIRSPDPKDDLGGGGLLTSPKEYGKVLTSLLRNGGKLLKPETVEGYGFERQLVDGKVGKAAHESLLKTFATIEGARVFTGGLPLPDAGHTDGKGGEIEYQHGLLGLLNRSRGEERWTLSWGGLPNLFWWVDPGEGLCGMYASQIVPPGDAVSLDLAVEWRHEMAKRFGRKSQES